MNIKLLKRKRERFESTQWVMGDDGYLENPAADKRCRFCQGHGVTDDGAIMEFLVNCDYCWTNKRPVRVTA